MDTGQMPIKKVIFLDIDGVLTSWRSHAAFDVGRGVWTEFDPTTVEMLRHVLEVGNYKLVISSTWRCGAKDMLHKQLRKHNLHGFLHSDLYTPQKISANRGDEIWLWLRNHPEVEEYIILDDSHDLATDQLPHTVFTDPAEGMLFEHYQELLKLANLDYQKIKEFYAKQTSN